MCASSKLLRAAWLQLLKQQPNPAWLVAAAADAARAKTPYLQAKATSVVRWLLKSLPEAQLAQHPSTPAGLLSIPQMPLKLAKELCSLGVKVPFKEMVAAARKRVAGEQLSKQPSAIAGPCYVTAKVDFIQLQTHVLHGMHEDEYSICS
jgi:hypothetical protein